MDNARNMERLKKIAKSFNLKGDIATIEPLGNGLINDTFIVKTEAADTPDYVLQRINTQIFTNVEVLQQNIEAVTRHIRMKLTERGTDDIDRRVLTFLNTPSGRTYTVDDEGCCWRMSVFIANSHTLDIVDCNSAKSCGKAFGEFESLLADIPDRDGRGTGLSLILIMIVAIICMAIAYFFTLLTRFAISRKREYMADAGGAELCGDPLALASALRKISDDPGLQNTQRDDVAQLFIIHPQGLTSGFASFFTSLFSTHPPTEKRIQVLEQF